jgi:hypothetical protein
MDTRSDSRNAQKQIVFDRINISNFKQYATADPAADPRPGPTETSIRALAMKS